MMLQNISPAEKCRHTVIFPGFIENFSGYLHEILTALAYLRYSTQHKY